MKTEEMDEFGFIDGVHVLTGQDFDERFFKREVDKDGNYTGRWINILTGTERDALGYDHDGIDVNGFERFDFENGDFRLRKSLFHAMGENGKRSKKGTLKDKEGRNFRGFKGKYYVGFDRFSMTKTISDNNGFDYNGKVLINNNTTATRDRNGFDIDGFNAKGFNRRGVHIDTSSDYDLEGKDKSGRLNPWIVCLKNAIVFIRNNRNATTNQLVEYLNRSMKDCPIYHNIDVDELDDLLDAGLTTYCMAIKCRDKTITNGLKELIASGILPPDGKTVKQYEFGKKHLELRKKYCMRRYGNKIGFPEGQDDERSFLL